MQRVLSFQMARVDETSEYVTKRLCFSFLFSVGFLCLLCGFLLGRFAIERSMEAQAQRTRAELAGNGLRNMEYLEQFVLRQLAEASFDRATDSSDSMEANARRVSRFFSNLSLVHEVTHPDASCIRAIVRGSREPDRYVILSVNGDGIVVALELAQILNEIHSAHEWRPRRSLMFCVSLVAEDVCPRTLPAFMQRRIVAYVAVHASPQVSTDSYVMLSGSDVARSIALEAIKTIPDRNWTYLDHEISGPRLSLDTPQVIFSLSAPAHEQTHGNQSLRSRGIILARMISRTMWRLSESTVIRWQPRYFNETVNRALESISVDEFRDAKEKLKATLRALLAAVKDFNAKIDAMENNIPALRARMWNDLLFDLDKALLCPDENSRSKTDLMEFHQLPHKSSDNAAAYLHEIAKCYEDATLILQER
ncbi:hypothetical protein HN011_010701 [Eciton burchellii]|nr:hypothetical protein HN011_010701 [Eciton burchellii]